ncbi:hypothetical protein BASA60_007285 [Batrachochytrium salamandrivorans]|nr:hypothetical protein BASA60_007285 [Batrachochytrium salamandrivorans]
MPVDRYSRRSLMLLQQPLQRRFIQEPSDIETLAIADIVMGPFASGTSTATSVLSDDEEEYDELDHIDYPIETADIYRMIQLDSYSHARPFPTIFSSSQDLGQVGEHDDQRLQRRYAIRGQNRLGRARPRRRLSDYVVAISATINHGNSYNSSMNLQLDSDDSIDPTHTQYNRYMDHDNAEDTEAVEYAAGEAQYATLRHSRRVNRTRAESSFDSDTSDPLGLDWPYEVFQYPPSARALQHEQTQTEHSVTSTAGVASAMSTGRLSPQQRLLTLSNSFSHINLRSAQSIPAAAISTTLEQQEDTAGSDSGDFISNSYSHSLSNTIYSAPFNNSVNHYSSISAPALPRNFDRESLFGYRGGHHTSSHTTTNAFLEERMDTSPYAPFVNSLKTPLPNFLDSVSVFPLSTIFSACFETQLAKLQTMLLDENGDLLSIRQVQHIRPTDIANSIDDLQHLEDSISRLRNVPHVGR